MTIKKLDFTYLGRIKTNFDQIEKLINELEKTSKVECAVDKKQLRKNDNLKSKINSYISWGYTNKNTQFYRANSKDNEKVFKKFIQATKLDNAVGSIIKQLPGQTIPWHQDNYIIFKKSLVKEGLRKGKKKIRRYMIFLTDWDFGHYFCVGSSIVNKWKRGDIITWEPHFYHCGSNAGVKPKVTMNITGLVNKNSIHLKKKRYYI